ncbi:hypothetical protein SAMN05661093_05117 [Kibdelosporangium aridum]|uniref:Uncharacterized protein n=1 Tax=Kibdelosporangium aridum TaxID=2030 RepID=A0A1W2EYP8_KIBAR|nr:hypothetical protein SAMN05661093_05117 [Kibdelosporangium aridum]
MQQATESAGWKLLKDVVIPVVIPLIVASWTSLGVVITLRQSTVNTASTNVSQIADGRSFIRKI